MLSLIFCIIEKYVNYPIVLLHPVFVMLTSYHFSRLSISIFMSLWSTTLLSLRLMPTFHEKCNKKTKTNYEIKLFYFSDSEILFILSCIYAFEHSSVQIEILYYAILMLILNVDLMVCVSWRS